MEKQIDGQEALKMLYASGLKINNKNKRLTDTKELVFIRIWNNPYISYKRLATEELMTHGTVKVYACEIFKMIGKLTQEEKVTQRTFKNIVLNFLLNPPTNMIDKIKGVLLQEKSTRQILKPENLILIQNYASSNHISEEQAINDLIEKGLKLTDD
jgi:hypothetical protein